MEFNFVFLLTQYVSFFENFKFKRSFLSIFIKSPIGVNIRKYIIPIIIGLMNLPIKSPNLIHSLVNGESNFGFKIAKSKNIKAITRDHILTSFFENKGKKEITKKTKNSKIPKDLFLFRFIKVFIYQKI